MNAFKSGLTIFCTMLLYTGLLYTVLPCPSLTAQERSGDHFVTDCIVTLIDDPTVFSGKPGLLKKVPKKGDHVTESQIVAQVDDTEAQLALQAAGYELIVAEKQAENDVDIRYAKEQENVTQAEVDEVVEANKRASNSISQSEVRRRKFQHRRSILATEQATRDHILAELQVEVSKAQRDAANQEVLMRSIKSPIVGVVTEVYGQVGEWVNAGDPIAKLIRLDKVRVIGYIDAKKWAPNEIKGRSVTVEVTLTRDRRQQFKGTIDYVAFEIDGTSNYQIWSDIDNRDEGGDFVIRPGADATMSINMNESINLTNIGADAGQRPELSR